MLLSLWACMRTWLDCGDSACVTLCPMAVCVGVVLSDKVGLCNMTAAQWFLVF